MSAPTGAEKPAVLVCSTVGYFEDDIRGECDECGGDVVWRPHAPAEARRVCITCFLAHLRTMPTIERRALSIQVTPESAAEAAAYARRRLF